MRFGTAQTSLALLSAFTIFVPQNNGQDGKKEKTTTPSGKYTDY